jgi:hypothetical protein
MPRTPRKPLGQLDVIFLEVNRDIIPMNRRPVGGDMVTEELAIGLTKHTMFVRNPKDPKRVYALAVPAELAQEAPWGDADDLEPAEPQDTLGPLEEALLSYLRDPSEGIMTYNDGGIRVTGVADETRVIAGNLLTHVMAERAARSEPPVNPAIEALFRWRDGATDRYGDDLVNLLLAEFSSDPSVSHHNRRDVPKEHQVGLMAFRALPYEEQAQLVEAFCRR